MRKIQVRLDWGTGTQILVGTLAEQDRRVYFEYDASFLASSLPISPFKLAVRAGLIEHTDRDFSPLFGLFNDSLPDGWGLLLMDREFRQRGVNPATLSVLDRLAYIGDRAMGALTYHPNTALDPDEDLSINLDALAHQAERILEGSVEDVLPALRVAGGSPGGARPKILVGVNDADHLIAGVATLPVGYRHYLIKFPSQQDGTDIGPIEAAYAGMARAAGIDMPPTRLFETNEGARYFGVERFDRPGNDRLHMHTLGGLFHADHRVPSLDYEGLLKGTLMLTRDRRATEEAYRRMVFNVAAHNRDDHVKNFSYLMDRTGTWRLAPAYDLVFSEGPGGEHTMAIGGEARRPTATDMLEVAEACDVPTPRARAIMEEVRAAVADWHNHARAVSVPRAATKRLADRLTDRSGVA